MDENEASSSELHSTDEIIVASDEPNQEATVEFESIEQDDEELSVDQLFNHLQVTNQLTQTTIATLATIFAADIYTGKKI